MEHKILKSTDGNYVELDVQLEAETDLALLISDGTIERWIPKSQLEDEPEMLDNGLARIIVPEWLAMKNELV